MKSKTQPKSTYLTLSLKAVFNDIVYFDPEDQVVYDMDRRMAIGYYTEARTCLIINFIFPVAVDDEFEVQYEDLTRYFNADHVTIKGKYVYYITSCGYIMQLGAYYPKSGADANLTIKLPRFLADDPDPEYNDDDIDECINLDVFN